MSLVPFVYTGDGTPGSGDSAFKVGNNLTARYNATAVVTHDGYGADPTGAADSLAAFQMAIDHVAAAGGGLVEVPPGVYSLSGSAALKSNVMLRGTGNARLVASALGYPQVTANGTSTSAAVAIVGTASPGDTQITLADGSITAAGGVLALTGSSGYDIYRDFELADVTNVAGNDVTLAAPLRNTYDAANGATAQAVVPVVGASVEGLAFKGAGGIVDDYVLATWARGFVVASCTASGGGGFRLEECDGGTVRNCQLADSGDAIRTNYTLDFHATENTVHDSENGIVIYNQSHDAKVTGNTTNNMAVVGIQANRWSRRALISDNNINETGSYGMICDWYSEGCTVIGNHFYRAGLVGNQTAMALTGNYHTIVGNVMEDCGRAATLEDSSYCSFTGNLFKNCSQNVNDATLTVSKSVNPIFGNTIANNVFIAGASGGQSTCISMFDNTADGQSMGHSITGNTCDESWRFVGITGVKHVAWSNNSYKGTGAMIVGDAMSLGTLRGDRRVVLRPGVDLADPGGIPGEPMFRAETRSTIVRATWTAIKASDAGSVPRQRIGASNGSSSRFVDIPAGSATLANVGAYDRVSLTIGETSEGIDAGGVMEGGGSVLYYNDGGGPNAGTFMVELEMIEWGKD